MKYLVIILILAMIVMLGLALWYDIEKVRSGQDNWWLLISITVIPLLIFWDIQVILEILND